MKKGILGTLGSLPAGETLKCITTSWQKGTSSCPPPALRGPVYSSQEPPTITTTGMPIFLLLLFTANGEITCPREVHLRDEALD